MATHSSVLAWRIPGMAEPCRLWGHTESDTTKMTQQQQHDSDIGKTITSSSVTDTVSLNLVFVGKARRGALFSTSELAVFGGHPLMLLRLHVGRRTDNCVSVPVDQVFSSTPNHSESQDHTSQVLRAVLLCAPLPCKFQGWHTGTGFVRGTSSVFLGKDKILYAGLSFQKLHTLSLNILFN